MHLAGTDVLRDTGDICRSESVTLECEHFVRAKVETSFASQFAQGPENPTVPADRSLAWGASDDVIIQIVHAPSFLDAS